MVKNKNDPCNSHHPHDRVFQQALSEKRVVKSLIKNYLPASISSLINLDTLKICRGKFINKKLEQTQSDILYSAKYRKNTNGLIYFLWEHQSSYDKNMLLRLLNYQLNIMEQHAKQENKKLPIIITILVYNGVISPYPGSTDFYSCFDDEILAKKIFLTPFHLLDLTVLDDDFLTKDSWSACPNLILKHLRSDDFLPALEKLKPHLKKTFIKDGKDFSETMLECIIRFTNITDNDKFIDIAKKISTMGDEKMASITARSFEKGFNEGIQEGIQEGIHEGKQEGKQEGIRAMAQTTVRNMLANNLTVKQIAKFTGLSIEYIEELISKIKTKQTTKA